MREVVGTVVVACVIGVSGWGCNRVETADFPGRDRRRPGKFRARKADLPADVKKKLDDLAARLKADPAGSYIEIEGHTDSTGSTELNERLGLARAENVKRYLYEAYQIPLHKINVISFGE